MKLQTGNVAYYFPTKDALERFIKKNGDKIRRPDTMFNVYGPNASTTFDFCYDKADRLYHWYHCYREWYVEHHYKVIMYAKQRTE